MILSRSFQQKIFHLLNIFILHTLFQNGDLERCPFWDSSKNQWPGFIVKQPDLVKMQIAQCLEGLEGICVAMMETAIFFFFGKEF